MILLVMNCDVPNGHLERHKYLPNCSCFSTSKKTRRRRTKLYHLLVSFCDKSRRLNLRAKITRQIANFLFVTKKKAQIDLNMQQSKRNS